MTDAPSPPRNPDALEGFLLDNLGSETTGVEGATLWLTSGEFYPDEAQLGPRLMVSVGDRLRPDGLLTATAVQVTRPPKVLGKLPSTMRRKVVQFASRNHSLLHAYWRGELSTPELLERLRPAPR
jgi:hypothetical protein